MSANFIDLATQQFTANVELLLQQMVLSSANFAWPLSIHLPVQISLSQTLRTKYILFITARFITLKKYVKNSVRTTPFELNPILK